MSDTPRKSGIRLPWSSAPELDAAGEASVASERASEPMLASASGPDPAASQTEPAFVPATDPAPAGPSAELLRDLVAAMRGVVTSSRDGALAALRTAVDEAGAGLDAATVERQAALRSKAEADIADIGSWERAEIERVRGEAVARVSRRRATLDQELAEASARRDADHASLQAKLDAYTGQMAAFMAELDHIADPASFAAAARRIPAAPTIDAAALPPVAPSAAPLAAPATTSEPLAERLAELDQQLAKGEPAAEQPSAAAGGDASTSIVVRGLGSFGAITSFKQALERAPGVSGLTLALGPGGEFVYSATHAASTDMAAAVRSIEPDADIARDGTTLNVKVSRPAAR